VTSTHSNDSYICPQWPAPKQIKAFSSTRQGGVSEMPYGSLNLGAHVGDQITDVTENRQRFADHINMPTSLRWLNQVHGTKTVTLPSKALGDLEADASFTQTKGQVCAVMTADCLPLLICNNKGTQVAACHAGWRGLCDGVIESSIAKFEDASDLMVWLGPAIGASAFEVGGEVKEAFVLQDKQAESAFKTSRNDGKWLADIYLLAKQRLKVLGVNQIYGGDYCTYEDESQFFSYRRDKQTGRLASVIWIDAES